MSIPGISRSSLSIALLVTSTVSCSVLSALSTTAQAATINYDLKTDWSDTSNPNGTWSYNEGTNPLPQVAAWQGSIGGWATSQPGWARSENSTSRLPVWFKSNGSETFVKDWQAGDIIVHTTDLLNGIGSGLSNLTWTSPISGTIGIGGGVWDGRDIGRSNNWAISLNGVSLTGGSLFDGDPYNRANPFNFAAGSGGAGVLSNIAVAPGDVVKLQLVSTSTAGDFVGVNLSINAVSATSTAVPEPFTIVGTLIGGTAAFRMRKKLSAAKLANAID
jgi:hypothetical protein